MGSIEGNQRRVEGTIFYKSLPQKINWKLKMEIWTNEKLS